MKVDQTRRLEVFYNCYVKGFLSINSGRITSPLSSWLWNLECLMGRGGWCVPGAAPSVLVGTYDKDEQ